MSKFTLDDLNEVLSKSGPLSEDELVKMFNAQLFRFTKYKIKLRRGYVYPLQSGKLYVLAHILPPVEKEDRKHAGAWRIGYIEQGNNEECKLLTAAGLVDSLKTGVKKYLESKKIPEEIKKYLASLLKQDKPGRPNSFQSDVTAPLPVPQLFQSDVRRAQNCKEYYQDLAEVERVQLAAGDKRSVQSPLSKLEQYQLDPEKFLAEKQTAKDKETKCVANKIKQLYKDDMKKGNKWPHKQEVAIAFSMCQKKKKKK